MERERKGEKIDKRDRKTARSKIRLREKKRIERKREKIET